MDSNDKPLITFALFAYNQEQFIAEAVQGALSQTYSPLEIILSDDCSSDRTFEIMQEMASKYQDPNQVIVRRNERNLGLIGHINRVMEIVQGELIVVAAGDDISLSNRVQRIYEEYELSSRRAYSLYSNAFLIQNDSSKRVLAYGEPLKPSMHTAEYFALRKRCVMGSSHAWHRDVFKLFGPLNEQGIFEDVVIPFRSVLLGEVRYIHEPLVLYRQHQDNLYNRNIKLNVLNLYNGQKRVLPGYIIAFQNRLQDLQKLLHLEPSRVSEISRLQKMVEQTVKDFELEAMLLESPFGRRLQLISTAAGHGTPMFRILEWVRLFFFPYGSLFISNLYIVLRKTSFFKKLLEVKRASTKGLRSL
jgi:glycosyltransferase involved in cell wall biosynthesis